ncbi:MAG: 6,7-dimethyl-8-ribityllumazine synthase [Micavibrio aeruginosavorus]|uniref:6,7-dimethyl-8-ribityllumazine synthase n=1 Tax=Micavibrio aeruginosavorus TaxID=349221 RepID=A0A7T5UGT0_9BACT|nr:MAG: 6,7-dimethyl-8-ribityllumazine synthase [Micavibrio aeruginosavorus]
MTDRVLIIEARYYNHINDMLLDGARKELVRHDVEPTVVTVPGALEIPAALNFAITKGDYAAFVVLGCIIRGETTHYDVVQNESAHGVYQLVLEHDLALGNAILTVENEAQALARADITRKNKGGEAARAAIEMLKLKRRFQ